MRSRMKFNNSIKYCFLIVCFIACVLFTGCIKKGKYRFMDDTSKIYNIEIVKLLEIETIENEGLKPVFETLCVIENKERFLGEFSQLVCTYRWNDPTGINKEYIGCTLLKIEYVDGDYELISHYAQAEYENDLVGGGKYDMYAGRYMFNEQEFNALIEKYLVETE